MAGKRKVDMEKVKKGLAKEPPPYVKVDEEHRLRVLVIGGDPSTRTAVATLVSCALEPFMGEMMIRNSFANSVTGQDVVDELAGYTVSIRDGGS